MVTKEIDSTNPIAIQCHKIKNRSFRQKGLAAAANENATVPIMAI